VSAYEAIGDLVEILRLVPDDAVPAAHVGSVVPSGSDDLPAVVATVSEAVELPIGIGGTDAVRRAGAAWSQTGGSRTKGTFAVQIFAGGAAEVELITGHVTGVLANPSHTLSRGFLDLDLRAVGATAELAVGRSDDVPAFSRTLEYGGLHEKVVTEDPGAGGVIARVRVTARDEFHEAFDIP
jgi:hypothetical protein